MLKFNNIYIQKTVRNKAENVQTCSSTEAIKFNVAFNFMFMF